MINIVDEPIATTNSIELHITSTGGELIDWEYNLYWGDPEEWEGCEIIPNPPNPSKIIIDENVSMCTEYGVSVRARDTSGKYVTSAGFKYVKTKGHAIVTEVDDFVIGADNPTITWKWNIYNKDYRYRVSITNARDDIIVNLSDGMEVHDIGDNKEAQCTLTQEQVNALYAIYVDGTGQFKFNVATKDAYGNYLEAHTIPFTVKLTKDESKLKPEFTDFIINKPDEILKGYTTVNIDYRLYVDDDDNIQSGARAKYGATIVEYRVVVWGLDHHFEDVDCVGLVEFIPNLAGDVGISVTAIDSHGYSTEVTKTITVTEYKPIEIVSARAYRGDPTNVINLELQGEWSKRPSIETPTIKYNYRLPSGAWESDDDVKITTPCAVTNSNFSYEGKVFELPDRIGNGQDIIVRFVVEDEVVAVEFELYVVSSSIISITGEKEGNIPIGRIRLNGQGIMAYMKQVNNLNDVTEAGIYSILSSPQTPAAGLPASLDVGGFLEVIACGLFVMQRATLYNASNPNDIHTYIRFYVNSGFKNWREIQYKEES